MRILKHVEAIDNIELDFTEVTEIVSVLLAACSPIVLFHLLQLHVDLVLYRTVPASHLTVVEGGKNATLWVEGCHLD